MVPAQVLPGDTAGQSFLPPISLPNTSAPVSVDQTIRNRPTMVQVPAADVGKIRNATSANAGSPR